jgi:hypothetical protein
MAKNYMKKCSPSLSKKQMHIKSMLRLHLTPLVFLPPRTPTTNVSKNVGEKEPSHTADANVN